MYGNDYDGLSLKISKSWREMLPFRPPWGHTGLASIYLTSWKFFVSDSVINNVRLSRFNFCYFLIHYDSTFFYCSVDWFNQLGIVTFTRPIFGRPLSAKKCAIDCSYRWTGDGFITPFCLFCQTIRPNIPQVNKKSNAPQVTVIIIYTITENARLGSDCLLVW